MEGGEPRRAQEIQSTSSEAQPDPRAYKAGVHLLKAKRAAYTNVPACTIPLLFPMFYVTNYVLPTSRLVLVADV